MAENDNKDFVNDVLAMLPEGKVREAEHPEGIEMEEWTFTNDKTNPAIRQMFHLLHQSVFKNKVGVMHAKLKDKDEVHTLIVGVEVVDGQVLTFPIAKVLTEAEQGNYLAPDGSGGWLGGDED